MTQPKLELSPLQKLKRFEAMMEIYNEAKSIVISFGGKPEAFNEVDMLTRKIHDTLIKEVSGGVVCENEAGDSKIVDKEYLTQRMEHLSKTMWP